MHLEFKLRLDRRPLSTSNPNLPGQFIFKILSDDLLMLTLDSLTTLVGDNRISGELVISPSETHGVDFTLVDFRGHDDIYMKSVLGFYLWESVSVQDGELTFTIDSDFRPPAKYTDLEILAQAKRRISDARRWNRRDTRDCERDDARKSWSLFCTLRRSVVDVDGEYNHKNTPMEFIRQSIEDRCPDAEFDHILMEYNNATTTHADILSLFDAAADKVNAELAADRRP